MKSGLRKRYINLRKTALTDEQREIMSGNIANSVLSMDSLQKAENIFCYSAYNGETETDKLINRLLEMGKYVYLPLCDVSTKTMSACKIESLADLRLGEYGIKEPNGAVISPENIDFIIMPLVAFDRKKTRLGYGGGYYDKYLTETKAVKCGIAYSIQEAESLPKEEYDISLDLIVTEKEIIY